MILKISFSRFKTFFDIGANVGQTVTWVLKSSPYLKIYSFEPIKKPFFELEKKFRNYPNIFIYNFAFGENEKVVEVPLFENSELNSLKKEILNNKKSGFYQNVQVSTLDRYFVENKIKKIDFLKLDTEGLELEVLKGGEYCLNNGYIKFILAEVGFSDNDFRHTNFWELNDFLESKGFVFYHMYFPNFSHKQLKKGTHPSNALFVNKSCIKV